MNMDEADFWNEKVEQLCSELASIAHVVNKQRVATDNLIDEIARLRQQVTKYVTAHTH